MLFAVAPALLLVVLLTLLRERPSDMGLAPLGAGTPSQASAAAGGMEYRDALRTPVFWMIAAAGMMTFYCILGTSAHVFLYLRGLGVPVAEAARGLSWLFVMGLIGKFVFGYVADRLPHKTVLVINVGIMLAGSLALASMRPGGFWPFVVLFGLGWGGIYTMLQLLTIDAFGLKAAGKVLGTRTVVDALGGGLGPWLTGILFDRTGSYQVPFMVISGLVALTFVTAALLRVETGARPAAAGRA
jgi:MFS family permease